jgi:hypothetical protein
LSPVGFGVKLATTPLIAGTFEAEVNFILFYEYSLYYIIGWVQACTPAFFLFH